MGYIKLKEEYLKKLESSYEVLKEVLQYSDIGLFNKEEINNLNKLKQINKRFLDKLNAGEIEVAIIGMENSGKSSLANAFVKLNEAFPIGSNRTTFTSTRLKYGKEDKAVVEFFTESEFNQNFKEMLKKVKYPDVEVSFELLDLNMYESFFEDKLRVEDIDTYRNYKANIHKDICDILEGKEQIKKYLNNATKEFSKTEIEDRKLKRFITDKYIARTVAKVEIFLSSLENMKEMVLYDVPGFNSITEKHKIETKEALKQADAIILVKNVAENSDLTGEEVDILKDYDELGLPLSEKLFVFGTKVDRLDSIEEVKENIKTLEENVTKQLCVKNERIFIGSPKAYLGQKGIISEDVRDILSKMNKFGLANNIYEIDSLRNSIKKFYEYEAFDNIQKQINKNISEIKNILSEVISRIDVTELENIQMENNEIMIDYLRSVESNLSNRLSEEKTKIKYEINEDKPFSKQLKSKIQDLLEGITIEDLEKENIQVTDTRDEFAVEKVNIRVRERLFQTATNDFQQIIVDMANDKFEQILENLNTIILEKVFFVTSENIYYEELKRNLSIFINEIIADVKYNETSFVYLIDRFSRDLMAIVLNSAKGSATRKGKFKEAQNEFLSLAFYYEDVKNLDSIYSLNLIRKILNLETHISLEQFVLDKYPSFNQYKDELEDVMVLLETKKLSPKLVEKIVENSIKNIKSINDNNIEIIKDKLLDNIDFIKIEGNDLEEIYKEVEQSQTKEELLAELNNDIAVLKELLQKAVIKAIGLEVAFIVSIVKTIDKISENSVIDEFIKRNFLKLKAQELSKTEEKKVILEHKKRINEKIKNLLSKI